MNTRKKERLKPLAGEALISLPSTLSTTSSVLDPFGGSQSLFETTSFSSLGPFTESLFMTENWTEFPEQDDHHRRRSQMTIADREPLSPLSRANMKRIEDLLTPVRPYSRQGIPASIKRSSLPHVASVERPRTQGGFPRHSSVTLSGGASVGKDTHPNSSLVEVIRRPRTSGINVFEKPVTVGDVLKSNAPMANSDVSAKEVVAKLARVGKLAFLTPDDERGALPGLSGQWNAEKRVSFMLNKARKRAEVGAALEQRVQQCAPPPAELTKDPKVFAEYVEASIRGCAPEAKQQHLSELASVREERMLRAKQKKEILQKEFEETLDWDTKRQNLRLARRADQERAFAITVRMKLGISVLSILHEIIHNRKARGVVPEAHVAACSMQRLVRGFLARNRVRNLRRLKRAAGGMIFRFRERHREKQRRRAADLIVLFAKDFGAILSGTLNATWPRQARLYRMRILKCQRLARDYLVCTRAREYALTLKWERESAIIEASKCNREVAVWMEARMNAAATASSLMPSGLLNSNNGGSSSNIQPAAHAPSHAPAEPGKRVRKMSVSSVADKPVKAEVPLLSEMMERPLGAKVDGASKSSKRSSLPTVSMSSALHNASDNAKGVVDAPSWKIAPSTRRRLIRTYLTKVRTEFRLARKTWEQENGVRAVKIRVAIHDEAGAEVARPTRRVSALARRGSAGFYVRNFMTGATCTDTQCPIKDLRLYGFPNISVLHRLISSCLGVHQLEEK